MRDVARRAAVSLKTVSRVVNGEPNVSAAVRERVEAAIAALDYRPDPAASGLRRADRRTRTVAAILERLSNPFSAAVLAALVDAARERDVVVLSADSSGAGVERGAVLALLDRHVDGMVLMPGGGPHGWMRERLAGAPVVMVDRPAPGLDSDVVVTDNRGGARGAVAHLAARGHRRIAFLGGGAGIYTTRERLAGWRAEVAARGLDDDAALVRVGLDGSAAARAAALELLDDAAPTAVFATQNVLTVGAIRALHERGLQHRVALVGFDDVELAELLDPGITVIAQAPAEIGRVAAERLLARIDGDDGPPRTCVVAADLLTRGSGELTPA